MTAPRIDLQGLATVGLLAWLAPGIAGQQFTDVAATNLPPFGGWTEGVRWGDWDLDGDLDLVFANGGDLGSQQSRLLINNGLAQGGTLGIFQDKTSSQLVPNLPQSSRDVIPVDVENDGDLDLYFSNHSMNGSQSNTWFVNQGGAQGGTAGKFHLDMSRWFGIGQPGSSVPPALVISSGNFSGGFVDWSCHCDFADVDLDGDKDLLHASYGMSFSGNVMSRLFLNGDNGATLGRFNEYNPSGIVSGINIAPGSAAGFLEGTQLGNTLDSTGITHDITSTALDADFGDLDGDFDNDIMHASKDTQSRLYQNRYFENGETLGNEQSSTRLYRDVTSAWYTTLSIPGANYDNDYHDMDNDNDIDAYLLGYVGTGDRWAVNSGTGVFSNFAVVPNSNNDDNEIDWHDFDNDGDVDPFITALSAVDRFYKNQFAETGNIDLIQVVLGSGPPNVVTFSADIGDMDNDGDTDIASSLLNGSNEKLLKNSLDVPDPIAPRVPHVQSLTATAPSSVPRRIVARVFDNVNDEYFAQAAGVLNFTVNGAVKSLPAHYAGGNLFRATLPGYWFGNISYSISVTDRAGNTGTSPVKNVTIPIAGFTTFGSASTGCHGAIALGVNSAPTISNSEFAMTCTGAPANALALCIASNAQGSGIDEFGAGIPMWASVLAATDVYALDTYADGAGLATAAVAISNNSSLVGLNYYFQFVFADISCSAPVYESNGGHLTILP